MDEVDFERTSKNQLLARYEGQTETQLIETNDTLRLIYKGSDKTFVGGELVDSLPNQMPLYKKGRIFALGVEALLAYYGLEEDAVKIDEEFQKFSITHPRHGTLVETYLSDGQFLEVNWFSKWTETLEEKTLTIEAKRAYNDKNVNRYLSLVPKSFDRC